MTDLDLFRNPVSTPDTTKTRDRVNDMDLIVSVLKTATLAGYRLVGVHERVYRVIGGDEVELVSRTEDDAVHQLIDAKWFTVGGNRTYRHEGASVVRASVLVTKATRQTTARWNALSRPPTWAPVADRPA